MVLPRTDIATITEPRKTAAMQAPTTMLQTTRTFFLAVALCVPGTCLAAVPGQSIQAMAWQIVVVLIVLLSLLASAALPCAAQKQWKGGWRLVAQAPLAVLLAWSLVILATKALQPGSHPMWELELFSWAMLNMIYMVVMLTARKVISREEGN